MAVVESKVTQTVIYGRRTEESPNYSLCIHQSESGEVTDMRYPCDHVDSNSGLLSSSKGGKGTVACSLAGQCKNIKLLLHLETTGK